MTRVIRSDEIVRLFDMVMEYDIVRIPRLSSDYTFDVFVEAVESRPVDRARAVLYYTLARRVRGIMEEMVAEYIVKPVCVLVNDYLSDVDMLHAIAKTQNGVICH